MELKHNNPKIQITLCVIIFIALIGEIFFCIHKCIKLGTNNIINYTENGTIDYKVYLKDNEFYEKNYLDKDMIYVASLIDKVSIDYDYLFNTDKENDYTFTFNTTATLLIRNKTEDKIFFEKNYDLDSDENHITKDTEYKNNISIDYSYYNNLASTFKTKYAIDSSSFLRVTLEINKKSEEVELETSTMYIDIPLSEQTINIKLTTFGLQNKSKIVEESKYQVNNLIYVLFIAISIIFCALDILVLRLLYNKRTPYQKEVNKILREYDRLIVETNVEPPTEKNIYNLKEFKELLDVRDNLKLPVLFCESKKNKKAYFYITHEQDLYLYTIINHEEKHEKK